MGNNLKFNSSVCTTREQSQRLLELGLKPETADMKHFFDDRDDYSFFHHWKCFPYEWNEESLVDSENIPAWSLHRLLEIAIKGNKTFGLDITNKNNIDYCYERLICDIERLINVKAFNKEYLKQ